MDNSVKENPLILKKDMQHVGLKKVEEFYLSDGWYANELNAQ